jgi:speckle-type POZ protein
MNFSMTKTFVLKKETIEILPNAKFHLTIQCNQSNQRGVLEIDLCNMTEAKDLFNIEVGLRVDHQLDSHQPPKWQTDVKYFTTNHGKINTLLLSLFQMHVHSGDPPSMSFKCSFEIVLKVPNDLNSLNTAMSKLFSEAELTDVEIICGDQTFKCHKLILALKSDVFKAMLYTNKCTENTTGTICVDDIDAKAMNTLLKYLYHNKITYKEATDIDLIVAANKYNIVDLVAKCEKNIFLTMSMTNIMDVLAVSKYLPTPDLFEKARLFFSERMGREKVQEGQKWLKLRTQNPTLGCEILESCLNMEKSNGNEEK